MHESLPTKSHLERMVTAHAQATGIAAARLRRWITTMVLLGSLERVRTHDDEYRFVVKGGVAMELRIGQTARATTDVDATFYGAPGELERTLEDAFATPFNGFGLRALPATTIGATGAQRVAVRVTYRDKPWATLDLELAVSDPPADIEVIPGINLDPFGLMGPQQVAALSVRFQLAQKLHAVSQTFAVGENRRVRDVVDILLLRELAPPLDQLRVACTTVFEERELHDWPPTITVYDSWQREHERICVLTGFEIIDINAAVNEVHAFIAEIDSAR